ncbi:MAG: lytic transglycosylase domain-containing protein [Patescibacteria group bacterium]|jgi:hypothetical protein
MAKSKLIAILVIAFIVIFYGVSPVKASFKYDDSGCCVCPPWDGMGIDDTKRENAGPPVIYIDDTQPLMTPSKPSCLRYEREEFKIVRKCDLFEVSCSQVNNKTEKRGLPITPPTLEVLKFIKLQDRATLSQEKDASGNQYYEIPWIAEAISSLYKFGVSAAAILAVVMIIVGGFIWLTSAGNQTQITEAKGYIFGAAIGLLIALGSYVLLYTINPELVRLKPIKIPYVEHENLEEVAGDGPITYSGGWAGGNVDTYDAILSQYAGSAGIDCTKLKAHMLEESGGNPNAVSPSNACGLIQLLPSTAGKTCEELKDPETNIAAAAKYYKQIQDNPCPSSAKYKSGKSVTCDASKSGCNKNDEKYVIAAYNGGQGVNCNSSESSCTNTTWWQCSTNSVYQQTRNYVQKVQSTEATLKSNGWGCN